LSETWNFIIVFTEARQFSRSRSRLIPSITILLIILSATNKIERYTMFFIIVDALQVLGGFSAHRQGLENCTHSIWCVPGLLLLPLAWLG
jgi:hypothetical protein